MSYLDDLVAQILASIPKAAPNPIEGTVSDAYIDPISGNRLVFVGYSGGSNIPAQWSSDFELVIGAKGLAGIKGAPVLIVTNTSPATISTMLVKG